MIQLEKNFIKFEVKNVEFYNCVFKVNEIIDIFYVAVRGVDEEAGAVQRVLNKSRIKEIKKFILNGNMFLNSFILNWTDIDNPPRIIGDKIVLNTSSGAAQVIDGQHRLEGLKEAVQENQDIGNKEILVSLGVNMSTEEAAYFFLNINSEQKPVPKSLIYDLYGIGYRDTKEFAIERSSEIARLLNKNEDSPYYSLIKFPGTPRGKGVIDLSTVVSSLKKYVEPDRGFYTLNLDTLELQTMAILNFYKVLEKAYGEEWYKKTKNPFMKSAGFYSATDFFCSKVMEKCAEKRSFKVETIESLLKLDSEELLYQKDISKLDGKTARIKIKEFLETNMLDIAQTGEEYEF
ncbi:DGQHR domain-containing protein [Enterococcus sp. AZ192]|uniref:DGQHR domain-containing protein n=1 Tax=unclassified Enterococcus TaxID=2608891 RepID=UPI003D29CFD0